MQVRGTKAPLQGGSSNPSHLGSRALCPTGKLMTLHFTTRQALGSEVRGRQGPRRKSKDGSRAEGRGPGKGLGCVP